MLLDRLSNATVTMALPPRLKRALEYLRTTDLNTVSLGRHEIDSDRIVALVQEYVTRSTAQCQWEAHRRHIDVQLVVSGDERVGYAHLADAREREPYDAEKDVAFFEPGENAFIMRPGAFAIFWPTDVHAPQGAVVAPVPVRKIVVKVAID